MALAPIPEYEGKSPYVFVTYAKQDEKIAYSIAVKMFNEGFRLWSSAACGNPSTIRIAERLRNSAVVMVFLSKGYLKYASYDEFEPRAVVASRNPKIVICLDSTPLGAGWNIVDFPAGIRYRPDMPEELWLRINSSDALEKCRGAWPSRPMQVPFDSNEAIADVVENIKPADISGEMNSLNSVMSSFGAGLDNSDISNITLFQPRKPEADKSSRRDDNGAQESSQEQEYYAIENLIDNYPAPEPAEKKQYDNMLTLIKGFMQKNSAADDESAAYADDMPQETQTADVGELHGEFQPVSPIRFNGMDMAEDKQDKPVVLTQDADNSPIDTTDIDYLRQSDLYSYGYDYLNGYGMSKRHSVAAEPTYAETGENVDVVANDAAEAPQDQPDSEDESDSVAAFATEAAQSIAQNPSLDERLPEANSSGGAAASYAAELRDDSNSPVSQKLFKYSEDIPQPALSFERPSDSTARPKPPAQTEHNPAAKKKLSAVRVKYRRRYRVPVKTVQDSDYDGRVYKVNGKWVLGGIYRRKMQGVGYTEVKNISQPRHEVAVKPITDIHPLHNLRRADYSLNEGSRLIGAVDRYIKQNDGGTSASDRAIEARKALAVEQRRRLPEPKAQPVEASAAKVSLAASAEQPAVPARKHKFSHDMGIKKSLLLPMQNPTTVEPDEDDSGEIHRRYGMRAEETAQKTKPSSDEAPKFNNAGKSDIFSDDDSLLKLPNGDNQPKINYDSSAYRDMNLSEIIFSDISNISQLNGKKPQKKRNK